MTSLLSEGIKPFFLKSYFFEYEAGQEVKNAAIIGGSAVIQLSLSLPSH